MPSTSKTGGGDFGFRDLGFRCIRVYGVRLEVSLSSGNLEQPAKPDFAVITSFSNPSKIL